MKLITGLLVFAFALGAHSQEDTLMSVQDELGLTHRFFETLMGINRGQLSAYIYRVTRAVLRSHFETYEFIYVNGAETRDHIDGLTGANEQEEECLEQFRRRFDLQKQRFGQRLARCIGGVNNILSTWNDFVNVAHGGAQLQAAQVQNYGFNMFARSEVFDGPDDFTAILKADLRDTIFRLLGIVDTVEEFINNISIDIDNIEFEFVRCDKELEEEVMVELEFERNGANACVGLGPIDPDPSHTK